MPDDWISTFFDEPSSPQKEENASPVPFSSASTPLSTGDPEIDQRLKFVEKSSDNLKKQLDEIFLKTGMTPQMITDYLNNPNNFSPYEWPKIQKKREQLQEKIWQMLGYKSKENASAKKLIKSSKDRKGKTLGARKNWMPMR